MTVTAKPYGQFAKSLCEGKLNLGSDTLKVMLCTSSYVPSEDTHVFKSDVTGEVVGTGYDAGGQALTNVTVTYDAGTNTTKIDADNPQWTDSTITADVAVFYDDTPALDADKPLISYALFGESIISSSGNFTITLDNAGLATLQAS